MKYMLMNQYYVPPVLYEETIHVAKASYTNTFAFTFTNVHQVILEKITDRNLLGTSVLHALI